MNADDVERRVHAVLDGPRPAPLILAGDPILRRGAVRYDRQLDQDTLHRLIDLMVETLQHAGGVGLAAVQIGVPIAVAVIEDPAAVSPDIAEARERTRLPLRVLLNPRYDPIASDISEFYEGCLSVPGWQAVVRRPRLVRLIAEDTDGSPIEDTIAGWPARIVQHEVDHLNGRLYLDSAIMRSLTTQDHYLQRWNTPRPDLASEALGFRLGA